MSPIGHNGSAPSPFSVVGIVASLGGLEAVSTVLGGLPERLPVPVFVAVHSRRTGSADGLVQVLQRACALPVRGLVDGDAMPRLGVSVIPSGYATEVRSGRVRLTPGPGWSDGDALLASIATWAGPAPIGVILTGLQRDGTAGARAVKRAGGRVIAQDPTTARGPSMPASAIATGCVDYVLPVSHVAPALVALTMARGAAELLAVPTPSWAQLHP
ncbi:MAG TPA: chemotaxis protein CheB [Sporichthya sp.]|nr:chemotaxis protein CheB [Sporichthya sp.]